MAIEHHLERADIAVADETHQLFVGERPQASAVTCPANPQRQPCQTGGAPPQPVGRRWRPSRVSRSARIQPFLISGPALARTWALLNGLSNAPLGVIGWST